MADRRRSEDSRMAVTVAFDADEETLVDRRKLLAMVAERDRYWQALVDIRSWENWQVDSVGTWREIAERALNDA